MGNSFINLLDFAMYSVLYDKDKFFLEVLHSMKMRPSLRKCCCFAVKFSTGTA